MNQDIALLATPANARRLLLFRRVCKLDLAPEIVALATQDCLDEQVFDSMVCPYDSVRYAISQFLLDCNLRGGVQVAYHPTMNPLALLNVVRVAAPPQIMVVSARRRVWSMAASALGLAVQMTSPTALLEEHVNRRTVVIMEVDDQMGISRYHLRNICREYPHLIIYDVSDVDRLVPWAVWGQLLFPTLPHPLMPRLVADVPDDWKAVPLVAFALLYNICILPHLITTPSIVAALDDDYIAKRLAHHSSLLTLT
jgi:hypothetical protein